MRTHTFYVYSICLFCFVLVIFCTATYFSCSTEIIISNLLRFSSNTNVLCQAIVIFFE